MGLTETALGGHRKMARVAAQQGTNLAFHPAKTVETGAVEMADAKIGGEIEEPLAIPGLGQPH
jgi:hypothetical protein